MNKKFSFTIEVPDEGHGVVYIFTSEKAFHEWELTGRKTYVSTRPITKDDLNIDLES